MRPVAASLGHELSRRPSAVQLPGLLRDAHRRGPRRPYAQAVPDRDSAGARRRSDLVSRDPVQHPVRSRPGADKRRSRCGAGQGHDARSYAVGADHRRQGRAAGLAQRCRRQVATNRQLSQAQVRRRGGDAEGAASMARGGGFRAPRPDPRRQSRGRRHLPYRGLSQGGGGLPGIARRSSASRNSAAAADSRFSSSAGSRRSKTSRPRSRRHAPTSPSWC